MQIVQSEKSTKAYAESKQSKHREKLHTWAYLEFWVSSRIRNVNAVEFQLKICIEEKERESSLSFISIVPYFN